MPEVVLLTVDGLQVPVIPLEDVVGSTGGIVPLQNGAIALNTGVDAEVTVTVCVVVVAH